MKKEELVSKTDLTIAELVYEKQKLKKAYNYYNCIRDEEQFKYLEENYGIGQPTSVEFIPLIRKHVDYLIGEYLEAPILPKISCKDSETIDFIFKEKQNLIAEERSRLLQTNLKNNLLKVLKGEQVQDLNIKEQLDKLTEDINENFISKYEIAGQNIVEYIIQSRNIDLLTKLKQLFTDLLVTGFTFFRSIPGKNNIEIECLNPLDVFPDLNYNSPYIRDCQRIVVRKYLNRNQILSKYGSRLSKEDREKIEETWNEYSEGVGSVYIRSVVNSQGYLATDGLRAGEEVTPYRSDTYWYNNHVIPVYEVEWIETDNNNIEQRYSSVRIGGEIYIINKEPDKVVRTKDFPEKAFLSVNGVWFNNRGNEPYSMVINCMVLQDKFDLLHFYRDNLIASSGSVGDFINLPTLPAILGDDLAERLMKWKAYKKQGIALIDTSQEGQLNTGQAPLNTMFNGYDDTVKVQAIQAIQLAIDSIEQTTSSITGVFRERLNGIQQRDAVSNVKMGANNSFIVTKQWHYQIDLVTREILLDALDCAKIVYKDGLTGAIILGNKLQKIFTALPKYYTTTDFDIHLITSSEVLKEMEQIKAMVPNFITAGIVPAEIIMDIVTSKSLSEMKLKVNKAIKKQKQENNQIQQLTQQLEQAQGNLQQLQQELQKSQTKIEQLNEAKLQIEKEKIQLQYQIDDFKAKTDRAFKENQAENDTKRTEIEFMQLYDNNPYNDKIKNI